MADSKITALTAISTVDPTADPLVIVDVSDTSMAASGTTKKSTINQLLGAGGTATLASATITGDLTVDTSTLVVNSSQNRVGIGFSGNASSGRLQISQPLGSTIDGALRITDDATTSFVFNNVSSGVSGIWSSGAIAFGVGSGTFTEAMRLNSTGLGVGTTDTTNARFNVRAGTGATGNSAFFSNSDGTYNPYLQIQHSSSGVKLFVSSAYGTPSNNLIFGNGGVSETMRIDGSGNLGIGVVPSAGGGCLQLKSGITFPATQVASSDANTLDDYEEGTWTATLKGSVSDPTTPVTATGRYTKIGRQVSIQLFVNNVTTTGASGRIQIDGLPFANNGTVEAISSVGFYNMATFTGVPFGLTSASGTVVDMWSSVSAGVFQAVNYNPGSVQYVWVNLTYTV